MDVPSTYERFGIHFRYPTNWQLQEEQDEGWPVSVVVQSPATAFWSLSLYRKLLPPETLAQEVLDALRSEYADIEVESVAARNPQQSGLCYELRFYCLDLVVAACLEVFDHADHTFVILSQAEDREFEQGRMVFDAITASIFLT